MLVSLNLRIKTADGSSGTASRVWEGKRYPMPKQSWATVNGKPEHRPEGVYHLSYSVNGKRKQEAVGKDSAAAFVKLKYKSLERQQDTLPSCNSPFITDVCYDFRESSSLISRWYVLARFKLAGIEIIAKPKKQTRIIATVFSVAGLAIPIPTQNNTYPGIMLASCAQKQTPRWKSRCRSSSTRKKL